MSTVLMECFKKQISKDKFVEWLRCHNIEDEGDILQEIEDLQYRGYDVSKIMGCIS